MHFHLVDFGDSLRIGDGKKRIAGCGDDYESNQRTAIAIADVLEDVGQKNSLRILSESSAGQFAETLRGPESMIDCDGMAVVNTPETQLGPGVRSVSHNALSFGHRRNLRTLHLFITEAVRGKQNAQVIALEVLGGNSVYTHVVTRRVMVQTGQIYLVAHRGHMRWAKTAQYTPPSVWRDWETVLSDSVLHFSMPWGELLESNRDAVDGRPPLPCKACNAKLKTVLSHAISGGPIRREGEHLLGTSPMASGGVERAPSPAPDPRPVLSPPAIQCPFDTRMGMGKRGIPIISFPIMLKGWRMPHLDPLATDYIRIADCDWFLGNIELVLKAGSNLAKSAWRDACYRI